MKTKITYKKLTPESALKLLRENDWKVEGVLVHDLDEPVPACPRTLVGINRDGFVALTPMGNQMLWRNCWQVIEETEWEVGDRVKSGSIGGTVELITNDGVWVRIWSNGCGSVDGCFSPSDLEPAPEPVDPFEEWYNGFDRELLANVSTHREAFEAGRAYERTHNL